MFLNKSRYPKNYFHAKPFGKSFNHIGNRPFFKFQSLKGKWTKLWTKLLTKTYINKRGVAGKKQNQSAETWPGWESKAVVGTYTVVKLCT